MCQGGVSTNLVSKLFVFEIPLHSTQNAFLFLIFDIFPILSDQIPVEVAWITFSQYKN